MHIRDISKSDESLFINMCTDFYSTDAVLLPMNEEKIKHTFNQALNHSPFLRLVFMEDDNEIVGYGLFAFYWSNEAGGMVAQLEEVYVLPEHRGKHYGHAFFDWFFTTYKNQVARFRLEACAHNQGAMKLYKSYGFEVLDYVQMIHDC